MKKRRKTSAATRRKQSEGQRRRWQRMRENIEAALSNDRREIESKEERR
jgi:hypothetical protein